MRVKALHVRDVVRVPDLGVGHARQVEGVVQDVIVAAGLVGEAVSVQVHLQERLAAHPEEHARRGRADLIGHDAAAVKEHAGVGLVHRRASPQAGLDAVAQTARVGVVDVDHLDGFRLQRVHHVHVEAVAAGADDDALAGVVAYHAVLGAGIDAGNLALFLDELDERGLVVYLKALRLAVLLEDAGGHAVRALRGAHLQGVAHVVDRVADGLGVVVLLKADAQARLRHAVGVPVDRLAGVIGPELVQALIAVTVALAVHLGDDVELVRVLAALDLLAAADGRQRIADARAAVGLVKLFDEDGLGALLNRSARGEHARRARADDQHLGVDGRNDVADLGFFAQPVLSRGFLSRGLRLQQAHVDALRLRDTGFARLPDRVGGAGRAAHRVELVALLGHNLLGQLLSRHAADAHGLACGLDRRAEDRGFIHRDGHHDLAAKARRARRVGTRGVDRSILRKTHACHAGHRRRSQRALEK